MKHWNKIFIAALVVGLLSGCTAPTVNPSPTGTASPSPTAAPVKEVPLVETEDVIQRLAGVPRDTVLYTVDGDGVTAEQLYFWLAASVEQTGGNLFGGADKIDWTSQQEGKNISDLMLEDAKQVATLYRVIETQAAKNNTTLDAQAWEGLQAEFAQNIEEMGKEEYANALNKMGMSDNGFRRLATVSNLHGALKDSLYPIEEEKVPSDQELIAQAEKDGLLFAKHILIKTVDDQRQPLPEAEQAAAKTKAEGILKELQASKDLPATFEELMKENSQDARDQKGDLYAPDGYLFGEAEMVPEFEAAAKALKIGEISGLVKTDFGYHILLRLPLDNAPVKDRWDSKQVEKTQEKQAEASQKMKKATDEWVAAAKVVDNPEMAKVDVKAFYDALTAYRATLEPAPAPSATPSATPANP